MTLSVDRPSDPVAAPVETVGRAAEARRLAGAMLRNPGALVGVTIVACLVLCAFLAPAIAPYSPFKMGAGRRLEPPSAAHLFGTDEFGRDLLSRVLFGAPLTLEIGMIAVGISLGSGLLIGLVGGYAGGWTERILMRSADVLFSFTDTLIALAAVSVLGPSLENAMIAVGIAAIPYYARVTYGVVLVEKSKPYIDGAVAAGAGHLRIILIHLLPNVIPPLIVVASLGVSAAVLAAAGLSFLGLGAQPPTPEWGAMLAGGRDFFHRAPWIVTFPGLAIALSVLGFNLLGDGLREALDPRQRQQ
jgi:peptide/nickel transport system permease protein